jgi:hypothetical protein
MKIEPLHTKIEKTIELVNGVMVLENPVGFPHNESNLYLIGQDGKIIWEAERPNVSTFFMRVKLNDDGDTFSTYTTGGHACENLIRTGKLISFTTFQ